jgi:hypothetical protein
MLKPLLNHMKNKPFKSGDAVVYDAPDGGSASAVVVSLGITSARQYLVLRFAVPYAGNQHAIVYDNDWNRLTKFGNNLFLVTT